MGKIVTAQFGGSAAIWCVCLLFFQSALFLGYLMTYALTRLPVAAQACAYCIMWGISLAFLNLPPPQNWYLNVHDEPVLSLLALLSLYLALPCLLLSSVSGLLQAWYAEDQLGDPYPLYSLSNVGSMSALLLYPLVIERFMGVSQSLALWKTGYMVVAALALASSLLILSRFIKSIRATEEFRVPASEGSGVPAGQNSASHTVHNKDSAANNESDANNIQQADEVEASQQGTRPATSQEPQPQKPLPPTWRAFVAWFGLSALGCMVLLVYTTYITQDLAPVPLLWVVPLALYLLTFIICFADGANHNQRIYLYAGPTLWLLEPFLHDFVLLDLLCVLAMLFSFCMVAMGELYRRKPSPRFLPTFYLAIAGGGVLGGMFINLAAPMLFDHYAERYIVVFAILIICFHKAFAENHVKTSLSLFYLVMFLLACALMHLYQAIALSQNVVARLRNFYGCLLVIQVEDEMRLVSGTIIHGSQYQEPSLKMVPTRYYQRSGTMGYMDKLVRSMHGNSPVKYGVIGLGVGGIAAYGKKNDRIVFYEIDPKVKTVADKYFTFLSSTPATVDVVIGDGRKALEKEPTQRFDMLVVDAFNGDAIPSHLLTQEAIKLYFRHLKTDGVLLVHLSNRYADLEPVVANLAVVMKLQAVTFNTNHGKYVAVCKSRLPLVPVPPPSKKGPNIPEITIQPARVDASVGIWTDDYSNLFAAILSNLTHK